MNRKGVFMPTGVIKRFDRKKGYGFIASDDEEGKDIFVHYSDIIGEGYRTLEPGDNVEFDLVDSNKGSKAVNVRVIE